MKNKPTVIVISVIFIVIMGILGYIALGEKNSSLEVIQFGSLILKIG